MAVSNTYHCASDQLQRGKAGKGVLTPCHSTVMIMYGVSKPVTKILTDTSSQLPHIIHKINEVLDEGNERWGKWKSRKPIETEMYVGTGTHCA